MNNLKIGIVKAGTVPQVVSIVIDRLVYCMKKQETNQVFGIQSNILNDNQFEVLPLPNTNEGARFFSISNSVWASQNSLIRNEFDILYVFYNKNEIELSQDIFNQTSACRIFLVPINIFNERDPLIQHLGFDSALNEVVNNIHKVKDTASSLLFSKKRLFLIKIPGNQSGVFLHEASKALLCEVYENSSKTDFDRLIIKLKEKYLEGNNYAFLLFNETFNEKELEEQFSAELDLDFRYVMIEEAQCIGGIPTVYDRLLAINLAEKMLDWALTDSQYSRVKAERKDIFKFEAF